MRTVVEAFDQQAARAPDAVAVVDGQTRLTYRRLRKRADQVARRLSEAGVVKGDRVAVFLERSVSLIAGILGVLKAGAAYVPIDRDQPAARIAAQLRDAQARVALSDPDGAPILRELGQAVEFVADTFDADSAGEPWELPLAPDDLAYLMYTSGSTGVPKAAMVEHGSITNLVTKPNYATLGPDDRLLQLGPIAFDAATFEIWGALLNGGCVVLAPAAPMLPEQLGEFLRAHRITKLWLTAALFHRQIDVDVEAFRGLDTVLSGGDVLSISHVRKLRAAVPDCAIVNGYGPTEATTFSCCHRIGPTEEFADSIPIGSPIQGAHVRIVDEHGDDVAEGRPGELWIAGAGVSRGYWQRPELTAEKFVVDATGTRFYRSGDLARRRPDGLLEFLGRLDGQFKLRGYRIEPGEIENALTEHEAVLQAAVALRDNHLGDTRLVAWVVPRDVAGLDRREVRRHLSTRLPAYMIPAAFVTLRELPVTANGKVDRKALPTPDWKRKDIYV